MLLEDLRTYREGRYKVAVITENEVAARNLKDKLDEEGLRCDVIRPGSNEDLLAGRIRIVYHNALPGYELIGSKVVLLSLIPDTRKAGFSLSASTFPSATEATEASLVLHVTLLKVASAGSRL